MDKSGKENVYQAFAVTWMCKTQLGNVTLTLRKKMKQIKNWPADERPREKLRQIGAAQMSNAELLAILIQQGTRERTAVDLAMEMLEKSHNKLAEFARSSLRDLMKTPGIGMAKASIIQAALELGRRRLADEHLTSETITGSASVAKYLQVKLMDFPHEVFAVLFLNRANRIRHFEIISSGGITGTVADPRIILKKALEEDAVSLILCHNHPSGNLKPSRADQELTSKIRHAAKYFDIAVLDHIIVSTEGYYSFADEGAI
jgi:DNA repair protein RadC